MSFPSNSIQPEIQGYFYRVAVYALLMDSVQNIPSIPSFDRKSNVDGKKQNQKAQCIYSSLKRRRFRSRISSRETNEICFRPSRDSLHPQCRTISPQLFHHGEESALEPAVPSTGEGVSVWSPLRERRRAIPTSPGTLRK